MNATMFVLVIKSVQINTKFSTISFFIHHIYSSESSNKEHRETFYARRKTLLEYDILHSWNTAREKKIALKWYIFTHGDQKPLLLIWINFNPSMDE